VRHVLPSGQGHFTTGLLVRVVEGMLQVPGHSVGGDGAVVFCFSSRWIFSAPLIALQLTLFVTSFKMLLPLVQSIIFLPCSKNAIIILSSRFRNCLLTFFPLLLDPFTTNFIPLPQPLADFVFNPQRSMYSQCCPLKTFLVCNFLVFCKTGFGSLIPCVLVSFLLDFLFLLFCLILNFLLFFLSFLPLFFLLSCFFFCLRFFLFLPILFLPLYTFLLLVFFFIFLPDFRLESLIFLCLFLLDFFNFFAFLCFLFLFFFLFVADLFIFCLASVNLGRRSTFPNDDFAKRSLFSEAWLIC